MCTNTLCLLLCKLTESHPMREIVQLCRKERRLVEEFGSSCDYEIDLRNGLHQPVLGPQRSDYAAKLSGAETGRKDGNLIDVTGEAVLKADR